MASQVTIAEVDEIVEVGELDPEVIVTPGVFVHRIVKITGGFGSHSYMESLFRRVLQEEREKQPADPLGDAKLGRATSPFPIKEDKACQA